MMRFVKIGAASILALLAATTASAFAAGATLPEDGSVLDFVKLVWDAFSKGQSLYAGSIALFGAMVLAKRYAPGKAGAWLHTDVGGALTALVMSFAASMASSLAGGAGVTLAMVKAATMIAVGAAGGYSLIKKLIVEPILKPMAAKAPKWAQPLFAIVFWFFDKKSPIEKAEAAGEAAVKADPAKGIGTPTEIE